MKVVLPIAITSSMVVESTLFDTPPAAYAVGTTYGLDIYVSVSGNLGEMRIYKSLQAGNTGNMPDSSPTWWEYSSSTFEPYVRGTNAFNELGYKVFDAATNKIYESLTTTSSNQPLNPVANPVWVTVTASAPAVPLAWSSATTYATGQCAYVETLGVGSVPSVTKRGVYISLTGANTNNPPLTSPTFWALVPTWPVDYTVECDYTVGQLVKTTTGSLHKALLSGNSYCPLNNTPLWLEVQPSNKTAMFDAQTSTTSVANRELSSTIANVTCDTVAILNAVADEATVIMRDGFGGEILYEKTINFLGGNVEDAWDYYFTDPTKRFTQGVFEGIPILPTAHITVTLRSTASVSLGNLIIGQSKDIGLVEYGCTAGMIDFSTKTTDSFGGTTFIKRGFKKTLNVRALVENHALNVIQNTLYSLRATPCLWIGSPEQELTEALVLYGFYRDFNTEIVYITHSYISIEIEGLI